MPTFAAVDIGSNSVRLKIASLVSHRLREVHADREVTRLGESVFANGLLSPDAMANTIKVLRRFHRAVQNAGTDNVRVLGTAALRDARNARAFEEWVRSATGWQLEVVSGIEEARLIHLGIVSNMRGSTANMLLMDLGGGSCELTVSNQGRIRETVSLPLGAVRLTGQFLHHDPPKKPELLQLRGFVERYVGRIADKIRSANPATVIATSGTAAALADYCHARYHTSGARAAAVSRQQMQQIFRQLSRLSLPERRKLTGIGPRRAEIIIAGAAVHSEILDRCGLGGFRYSPLGLRDGILADMAAKYDKSTRSGKQLEFQRADSIRDTMRRYNINQEHAERVRDFALQFFHDLQSMHQLPAGFQQLLEAAAMLYEVGDYINRNGRHRHTYYILSHSEILGYTPWERRIIAAMARYLGTSKPLDTHPAMKPLSPADRARVRKASLLLRMARALNLGRSGAVEKFTTRVQSAAVHVKVVAKARTGADLELWSFERERPYFRELFGRELVVVTD
ncbi:MAG: Ppx/GppA family phosphatase [Acidobacteriales bacterium]|nr:Ppx/GppA family phosphatase [Terriglobales bacterium]